MKNKILKILTSIFLFGLVILTGAGMVILAEIYGTELSIAVGIVMGILICAMLFRHIYVTVSNWKIFKK